MSKDAQQLSNGQIRVDIDERSYVLESKTILSKDLEHLSVEHVRDGLYSILYQGKSISAVVEATDPNRLVFTIGDTIVTLHIVDHRQQLLEAYGQQDVAGNHDGQIRAPMPGLVLKLQVEPGAEVSLNDPLLVLEAMKMENEIRSPGDGVVSAIFVAPGEAVLKNALLLELVPVIRAS